MDPFASEALVRPPRSAWRRWSNLLAPAAYLAGRAFGDRRVGAIAGGLALLLRWQLGRWFTEQPRYETLGRAGDVELRRYPLRVEARHHLAGELETAVERGYSLLECYVLGANERRETIAHGAPVLTTMYEGVYTVSFVMPGHHTIGTLPSPADRRVELSEVPAREIAVLPFRGGIGPEVLAAHADRLLQTLIDVGLIATGSITLATYDAPTTLPALRRNELWIELA